MADKLRPTQLNEIVGQKHLIGPNQPLTSLIKNKTPMSFIFYGPPGTGKTTLANVIANEWQLPFEKFNAAIDNKAKLQSLVKNHPDESFVLLLDEIHRLTKPIQDFLLPYVENGQIILIGATTANPIISIDPAVRSRTTLFELKPLRPNDIEIALKRAYKSLNQTPLKDESTLFTIAKYANGDVRNAINLLQTLIGLYGTNITNQQIEDYAKNQNFAFDKDGDFHYNTISALQKSIRGWDTDAALYYTALMCESGDLPTLIRRLIVIAYEDIGLADPNAAQQAVTALLASEQLGLPEARLSIANAVILLCNAPHSNSAHDAINAAIEDVKDNQQNEIPKHLQDSHYSGHQKLGAGIDYKYPHDYPKDWVAQQYLPTSIINHQYYHPKDNGHETDIKNRYQNIKLLQKEKLNQ